MLRFVLFLAAIAVPSISAAGTCDGALDTEIPAFETAKAGMLSGDFEAFYTAATPYAAQNEEVRTAFIAPLVANFPQGFDRCTTVMQRLDGPGYAQEITLYFAEGLQGPISVYLAAVDVDGVMQPMSVVYNSEMDKVFAELK